MKPREERVKTQAALMERYEEAKTELLKIPGVLYVAVGLKEKDNQLTDDIVFQVYVHEKKPENSLTKEEIIPKQIMGFDIDVLKMPIASQRDDSDEHRPIMGGIQIGTGNGFVGTLGCLARLNSDNSLVLLTNNHILYSHGTSKAGDTIGQPDFNHNCCCCCAYTSGGIGVILNPGIDNDLVDCALAKINPDIAANYVLGNNMSATQISITGTNNTVTVGDTVKKIGRTSGLTTGVVTAVNGPGSSKSNQINIKPAPTETYKFSTNNKLAFDDHGDSGSVVVNAAGEIVGLLWGGDEITSPVEITFVSHIQDVLSALSNAGIGITIVNTPPAHEAVTVKKTTSPIRTERQLRQQLLQSEKGKQLVNLMETHQKEVLHLINRNRKVGVTWQRNEGPAFVAHIVKSSKDPAFVVPNEIRGVNLQQLLIKMAGVLKESGSKALKNDIGQHALDIIDGSVGFNSVEAFMKNIGEEYVAIS